jgi:hypothetical protein
LDDTAAELDKQLEEEQLSLFSALSATIVDESHLGVFADDYDGFGLATDDEPAFDPLAADPEHDPLSLTLTLEELSPPDPSGRTRAEIKEELRFRNAEAARELVRFTGRNHAQVNSELNRLGGVRSVDDATVEQLERRATQAEKWLTDMKRIRPR